MVTDQKIKVDTDLFFFFFLSQLVVHFVWNRCGTFGSLPSPRNSHVCSYQLDNMIVVGGKDGHDSFCSDVYMMQSYIIFFVAKFNCNCDFLKNISSYKTLRHCLGLSIMRFLEADICCKSKFKNWLTCLYDDFFFYRQKFVERKSVKLLYNTVGGKTLIFLKKLLRLE